MKIPFRPRTIAFYAVTVTIVGAVASVYYGIQFAKSVSGSMHPAYAAKLGLIEQGMEPYTTRILFSPKKGGGYNYRGIVPVLGALPIGPLTGTTTLDLSDACKQVSGESCRFQAVMRGS